MVSLMGFRAVSGVIYGAVLSLVTPLVRASVEYPNSDIVLLLLFAVGYLVSYVGGLYTGLPKPTKVWKGVSVFYATSFISWVACYEVINLLTSWRG